MCPTRCPGNSSDSAAELTVVGLFSHGRRKRPVKSKFCYFLFLAPRIVKEPKGAIACSRCARFHRVPGRCICGDRRIPDAACDGFRADAVRRYRSRLRPVENFAVDALCSAAAVVALRMRGADVRRRRVQEARAMGFGFCGRASPRHVSRRPSAAPARRNTTGDRPLGAGVGCLATDARVSAALCARKGQPTRVVRHRSGRS